MKSFLFLACFVASIVLAADKSVVIKFKDNTELEGVVSTSISDTLGFTLKTKFGETHYNWSQVDINHLQKTNPELYKFYVQQSHGSAVNTNTTKIKLRDGTMLEGTVSTSNSDTQGFTFRSQFGSRYYDWNQVDLNYLSQTKPDLYQFYLQQTHIDDIRTDDQIALFLRGRFVFRTEANSLLKNYGSVLDQFNNAMRTKQVAQRNQQLSRLVDTNRPVLISLSQRCQVLSGIAHHRTLQTVLISYRNAFDALARLDYANFLYNYKFGQDALAGMQ